LRVGDDTALRIYQINSRSAVSELLDSLVCLAEIPSMGGLCTRKLDENDPLYGFLTLHTLKSRIH
jgi:hypothetical protein